MSSMKIKLKSKGVRNLLQSEEVDTMIGTFCNQIADRAGSGYEYDTRKGRNRIVGEVRAATARAYFSNLKNNTLLKAIGR